MCLKKLEGKVAVVTGAGAGIGRATAILFAGEGAKVVCADVSGKMGNETVKLIREDGGTAIFTETDVSKADSAKKMVDTAVTEYGRLDIGFNNAGVFTEASILDMTEEVWDRIMDINLKGVFLCSKYEVNQMLKQDSGGVIINTASECGVSGFPDLCGYCASKAGVILFTQSLATELARKKVRVVNLSPARIYTPMHSTGIDKLSVEEAESVREEIAESVPLGRWGTPEDIAKGALYLASDDASFITGSNLVIDGGTTSTIVWGRKTPGTST